MQSEALTNELKGNLFEYLVGLHLARLYGVEGQFLTSFAGGLKERLLGYERQLRRSNPQLLVDLMTLASATSNKIKASQNEECSVKNISIIGKLHGGRSKNLDYGEADLLLIQEQQIVTPISIKLAKEGSYVNTKSGGVNTFLSRYFASCLDAGHWQERLIQELEQSFFLMGATLYEMVGMEFNGTFGAEWGESGLSDLPGQLDRRMRRVIFHHYHNVISVIYNAFVHFFSSSYHPFIQSTLPLLGLGGADNLAQFSCFYNNKVAPSSETHSMINLSRVTYFDRATMLDQLPQIELLQLKDEVSSFELALADYLLQIRVKPMNAFTTMGLKINCSLKIR